MTPRVRIRLTAALAVTRGQRGVALPMALIVLVVLTSLAAAVLAVGTSETNIATNHKLTAQALALAEAGLESAFTAINTSLTGTSLIDSATSSFANLTVTAPTGDLAAIGTYSVQYKSIGNDTVEVVSTGTTSQGGARRILRAIMTSNLNSITAVLSDGDLTISGGTTVNGTCGSVHTNDDLSITGTGNLIAQNATATDTYSTSGTPTIGGVAGGNRPPKVVPNITPTVFRTQALTAMASDATMYLYDFSDTGSITRTVITAGTTVTTPVATLASNDTFDLAGSGSGGWKFKSTPSPTWEFTGTAQPGTTSASSPNNPSKAIFYVNGKAEVSADIGTSGSRWNATIISTGDLTVNSTSDPYLASALNDVIFVTGNDLSINGNPNIDQGIIAAARDIDIGGNVTITGSMIARRDTRLHGTVNVTYACGLDSGITAGLSEIAWGY